MLLWLSFCLSVFYFSLIDCFLFIIFFPQVPPPFCCYILCYYITTPCATLLDFFLFYLCTCERLCCCCCCCFDSLHFFLPLSTFDRYRFFFNVRMTVSYFRYLPFYSITEANKE